MGSILQPIGAQRSSEQEAPKQVQALTLCFSRKTVTIVENLGPTAEQRGKVKDIIAAIQRYGEGHINESVERRTFRRRVQQPGKTFDDLRELAKTCKFCTDDCMQKNIRDQIIEGLLDRDIIEDLLQEKDLTLTKAVAACRAQEAAKKQRAEMATPARDSLRVQATQRFPTLLVNSCPGCGSSLHPGGWKQCPAYKLTCRQCNKIGHLARVCRGQRPPSQGQNPFDPAPPGTQGVSVTPLRAAGSSPSFEPAPKIKVHLSSLNGQATVLALPDSGADICVTGMGLLEQLHKHPGNLLPSTVTPRAVNGTTMNPVGKLPVTISLGAEVHHDDFYIYPDVTGPLLVEGSKGAVHPPRMLPQPAISCREVPLGHHCQSDPTCVRHQIRIPLRV